MLPLIRLKVHYHVERQAINVIKFGQKFADKVANPEDMVVLKPYSIREKTNKKKEDLDQAFENVSIYQSVCELPHLLGFCRKKNGWKV